MNISDRLRDLAQDIRRYYSEPITPQLNELGKWADHLDEIASKVEQDEWDRYDEIIRKDMEND